MLALISWARSWGSLVYQLIGCRYHDEFPITHVLSIAFPEKTAEKGYQSFKMKVGTNVSEDVARIQVIRARVGKNITIRADVNQGWRNSAVTLKAIDQLCECKLDWLEQR